MRATGSHSIELEDVFVPDEHHAAPAPRAVAPVLERHLTVAAPIFMAPYIGIAERAAALARETARRARPMRCCSSLGELGNALTVAQMAFREMIEITNNFDFAPSNEVANRMLIRKTIAANAAIATVNKAVEVVGGSALLPVGGSSGCGATCRAPRSTRCPRRSSSPSPAASPSACRRSADPRFRSHRTATAWLRPCSIGVPVSVR